MSEDHSVQIPLFEGMVPPAELPDGEKLSARTLAAMQAHKQHMRPCPFEGCNGKLRYKNERNGKVRYQCDTPLPGATLRHYAEFLNDEEWIPPKRRPNRTKKEEGLKCPYCGGNKYDFGNSTKTGVTYYHCRKCTKTFRSVPGANGTKVVEQLDRQESDPGTPPCPYCGSRKNRAAKTTHLSPVELVITRHCRECKRSWRTTYMAKSEDDYQPAPKVSRQCPICGKRFQSLNPLSIYCCDRHRRTAEQRRRRERRKSKDTP